MIGFSTYLIYSLVRQGFLLTQQKSCSHNGLVAAVGARRWAKSSHTHKACGEVGARSVKKDDT